MANTKPRKGVTAQRIITAPDDLTDEIGRRLAAGQSFKEICSDPAMPSVPTLWRWRKDDPILDARLAVAAGVTRKPVRAPEPEEEREPGPETWTPLGIMLSRMRTLWDDGRAGDDEQREAISIAKDAAPYVHPRLSAVDARITHRDLRDMGEDDLIRELALLREQAGQLLRLPAVIDQLPEPEPSAVVDADQDGEESIPDIFDVDCQQER
jgi:hypothetical protein